MKKTFLLATALVSISAVSYAQSQPEAYVQSETEAIAYPKVKGLIRKIDSNGTTVSIKHDKIPNLDMPAMTMSFAAHHAGMLNGLKASDRVLFSADYVDELLTVVWIQKQKVAGAQ